jgi:TRAP-type uncharacterized transport system fused permease subunit
MFVYEPALLMIGDWTTIAAATASATVGVIALASGFFGYLLAPLTLWQRGVLIIGAFLLIVPELVSSIVGGVVLLAIGGLQLATRRRVAPRAG